MKPGIDHDAFDKTIRPQDDLFRHVNGKWFAETEIPADKAIYGSFHMLADDSEEAVKEILLEAAAKADDPAATRSAAEQQIGDLYMSFMDEQRANELGAAPIREELKQIDHLSSIAEATKLLGRFSKFGIGGLFGSYVDNDPGNPERYLVNLYNGGLGLPDEAYYREEKHAEIREAYVVHIARMLQYAGWQPEQADRDSKVIYEFEAALASIHWNLVDSRDAEKTYNLHSFNELEKIAPAFDFNLWLHAADLDQKILAESVVMMPSFFAGLGEHFNEANLPAIKLWLSWSVIRSMASYLSDDFVNEKFNFYGTKLSGTPQLRARWKRAVGLVEGALGEVIGQVYVEKYFGPAAKHQMDRLVDYLIAAYRDSIENLDWMTDATKKKALTKLSKFTPKIGYPAKWRDYSSLHIDRHDLVGNVRRANEFEHRREAAKIGSPIDRDEWFMTPQTVNAYYNPGFNEIVFPAAILQPPFFSEDADAAVNFGAIGAVIGHEIGHGFDDQGSKYDGDGALKSWWSDEDRAAFEERTKALIEQYNQLSPAQLDDSHRVNGELTIGENIGDLGGLSIAWKAYLLSLDGQEPPVIEGMTAAERFFFSWAQSWRTIGRDEMVIQRLATDPHSPPEFRCNQIVRNLDVFHRAFGTKPGDALWLEPEQRVSIW